MIYLTHLTLVLIIVLKAQATRITVYILLGYKSINTNRPEKVLQIHKKQKSQNSLLNNPLAALFILCALHALILRCVRSLVCLSSFVCVSKRKQSVRVVELHLPMPCCVYCVHAHCCLLLGLMAAEWH